MNEKKDSMRKLLQFNKGFTDPEKWIEYGTAHNFKRILADKLEKCPDCGNRSSKFIGQFIYYPLW